MAVIRCTPGADGRLAPVAVEFEPGDIVELQSGTSTAAAPVALEVLSIFSLASLSGDQDSVTLWIDLSGRRVTPMRTIRPDPKLPPPPPEDGAAIINFHHGRETGSSIKLVIDAAPAD
jgi:hypothetical protein